MWYVTLGGRQYNLGPNKDKAFETYKQMLAKPKAKSIASDSLACVIDAFLKWVRDTDRPIPTGWYRYRLERVF